MYSVLIVDDEEIIRRGLARAVDWEAHGFTVAHSSGTAADAIAYLEANEIDVAFTDIRMPKMSGLELGHVISERWPHIKIVVLSGYSNFAYAQEALTYRAFCYLLKPSKEAEIVQVLETLKQAIDRERRETRLASHSREVMDKAASLEAAGETTTKSVREAMDIIDRRYGEELDLESLASTLCLSPGHLCRLFRQHLGCTFKDYLTDVRIVKAKALLQDCTMKVYEVAARVGYSDQHYFSEVFKARTGLTPLAYRNRGGTET